MGGWSARLDPAQPVRILELGPGTGRFTFLFTHDLRRLLDGAGLGHIRTRHVCADLSTPLLDHIAGHEALAPLLERGLLDFAIFDAADPQPPLLRREGARSLANWLRTRSSLSPTICSTAFRRTASRFRTAACSRVPFTWPRRSSVCAMPVRHSARARPPRPTMSIPNSTSSSRIAAGETNPRSSSRLGR